MPAATYIPIGSTTTVNNTTPVISFTSIPSTYTDLVLVVMTKPASTPVSFGVGARFNSDSSASYTRTFYYGWSSTGTQSSGSYDTRLAFGNGGTTTSNQYSLSILEIYSYASTSVFKTCVARNTELTDVTSGQVLLWSNTSAINTISITATDDGNFASGCTFSLYGIKAE